MAGDWIKMRTNLDTNPRVIQMAAVLDVSELMVIGCLWKVWGWADQHSIDGNAVCVTDVTLDRFTGVTGFANEMRKVGWLAGNDLDLNFPNFGEHNGQTAKTRAETRERVRKHRNAKSVTDVTQTASPEKRREEKSNKESKKKKNQYSEDFELFWNTYPKAGRTAKAKAYIAFKKATKVCDVEKLISAAGEYARSDQGRGQFVKHATTWLNGGCWDDDREAWSDKQQNEGSIYNPRAGDRR